LFGIFGCIKACLDWSIEAPHKKLDFLERQGDPMTIFIFNYDKKFNQTGYGSRQEQN